jgi:hypothetical protein
MRNREKTIWARHGSLEYQLSASGRRQIMASRVLFTVLVFVATSVVTFCLWAYLCDVQ